jgi:predicted O-methyltransferase YrrM
LAAGLACDGQTSAEELGLLVDLASKVEAGKTIVEIGSFRGRSAVAMALASQANKIKLFAVDSYETAYAKKRNTNGSNSRVFHRDIFMLNLVLSGAASSTYCINLNSIEAASVMISTKIGFLFIDGDHSYESVKNDYENWIGSVEEGGIIAFHDSINQHWGSAKFVSELHDSPAVSKVTVVDSVTVFKKNKQ